MTTAVAQPSAGFERFSQRWGRVAAEGALYLGCYVFFDWVSSTEPFQALDINPWDPAPAASLLLLFLRGFAWAPFLFVGAILPDIVVRHLALPLSGTIAADLSEAVIYTSAAWILVRGLRMDTRLLTLRDVVCFVGVTTVASALMGFAYVASFEYWGLVRTGDPYDLMLEYWAGDLIGIIVVVPLVLVHRNPFVGLARFASLRSWELIAQSAAIVVAVWLLFKVVLPDGSHMFYALFVPLIWVTARSALPGVTLALFVTQFGMEVMAYAMGMHRTDIAKLQLLMIALSGTCLLLGALVGERGRALSSVARGEARLRTIIDMAPDGLLITDESGRIEISNRVAVDLLGESAEGVLGHRIDEFLVEHGTAERPDSAVRRQDGGEVPVEVSISSISIGDQENSVVTLHDITARRRLQAEQRQRQRAQEQASRSSLTEELAAALAHELNQPLAAIIGYAGAGQAVLKANPQATGRALDQLAKIAVQAERAGDIIRRLREFFRNAKLETGSVPLADLVQDVLRLFDDDKVHKDAAIVFDIPGGLSARIDRLQIEQVLVNLVRNGIEALAESSTPSPRVAITASRRGEGWIEISVGDNGPGVSAEIRDNLFQPFTTTRPAGMGLGLAISQSIVVAHGGRMWVEEGQTGGASFHFTVPAAPEGGLDADG